VVRKARRYGIAAVMAGLAIIAVISWRRIPRSLSVELPVASTEPKKVAGTVGVPGLTARSSTPAYPDGIDGVRRRQPRANEYPPVHFLSVNRELSAEFVQQFGIPGSDVRKVQTAIDTAAAALNALALRNATLSRPSPAVVEITIRALEGGPEIYDAFIDSLARILGESVASTIVRLYRRDIDEAFHSFGAESRRISIARGADSGYTVTEAFLTIDVMGETVAQRCGTLAELRQRLGGLAALLPPGF
jgi:hypothetical protein